MVDSEDQYSTEKASSVQSAILYDCEAEALSKSIRPRLSVSYMVKRRCCPERDQFDGFRSVKVLKFDTPPESPKNCPEAIEDSVRLQISQSRPVSFFMIKPRFCQVEISSVQSSQVVHWVLAKSSPINQLLIDIEHCHCFLKLVPLSRSWSEKWWARFSLPPASPIENRGTAIPIEDRDRPPASPIEERGTAIPIEDRVTAIPIVDLDRVIPDRLRLCGVMVTRLPVSLVWRKNDFVGPN
ncbi:hypothetical protein F2Q69_00034953 [Brassica cretica]|uniref:Uncharacterized protein n=1 Tax=Brassica cretica TaxID=69181 RepID=A0A8S9SW61_BRACR|nr:hypothetical protein F2Q69_00034953 [Brassica cretica]